MNLSFNIFSYKTDYFLNHAMCALLGREIKVKNIIFMFSLCSTFRYLFKPIFHGGIIHFQTEKLNHYWIEQDILITRST